MDDLVPQQEDRRQIAVEAIGPQVTALRRVDKLGIDPHLAFSLRTLPSST
jgi:hypothetical protein